MAETFLGIEVVSKDGGGGSKSGTGTDFYDAVQSAYDKTMESITLYKAVHHGGPQPTGTVRNPIFKEVNTTEIDISLRVGIKNVEKPRVTKDKALGMMEAIAKFLSEIDTKNPDLTNETTQKIYDTVKDVKKPKVNRRVMKDGTVIDADERLKLVEEGGTTYWSDRSHTYVKGRKTASGNWIEPADLSDEELQKLPNRIETR